MAGKKAQAKRAPSPSSSNTSSSEDEPENQVKSTQASRNPAAAAATTKVSQSAPPDRTPSSSGEESRGESSDESDSASDGDHGVTNQASNKKVPQQQVSSGKKAIEPPSSSESEPESGEDEDEEVETDDDAVPLSQRGETRIPDAAAKPVVSKPTTEEATANGAKKQQGDKKRKPPVAASPSKTKDKANDKTKDKEDNNDKKRKLAAVPPSPNDAGKKRFERVWTPEDELAVLRALLTFKNKEGHEPVSTTEIDDFYNSVKASFHTDFSRSQVAAKMHAIRRKYSNLVSGKNLKSSKKRITDPIGQEALDLGIAIWGKKTGTEVIGEIPETNVLLDNAEKSTGLVRPKAEFVERAVTASEKSRGDCSNYGPLSLKEAVSMPGADYGGAAIVDFIANEFNWMDRASIRQGIACLDSEECKKVEEIWGRLKYREMEFQIHRLEAATEMMKMVKSKEKP